MARSKDWDSLLAKKLKTKKFATAFINECLSEGMSVNQVVYTIVRAYGITELANKTGVPKTNITRFIKHPEKAREQTINKIVKPFGVKMGRTLEKA